MDYKEYIDELLKLNKCYDGYKLVGIYLFIRDCLMLISDDDNDKYCIECLYSMIGHKKTDKIISEFRNNNLPKEIQSIKDRFNIIEAIEETSKEHISFEYIIHMMFSTAINFTVRERLLTIMIYWYQCCYNPVVLNVATFKEILKHYNLNIQFINQYKEVLVSAYNKEKQYHKDKIINASKLDKS